MVVVVNDTDARTVLISVRASHGSSDCSGSEAISIQPEKQEVVNLAEG